MPWLEHINAMSEESGGEGTVKEFVDFVNRKL